MATLRTEQSSTQQDQPYGTTQGRESSDGPGLGSEIRQLVKDKTYEQFDTQKQRATNNLGHVASAVRGVTQSLRDSGQPGLADYATRAADGLERWTTVLQRQNPEQVLREVQSFARRSPALFLGAAFGVGVLAGRFFRSSAGRDDERWRQPPPYAPTSAADRRGTNGSPNGSVR